MGGNKGVALLKGMESWTLPQILYRAWATIQTVTENNSYFQFESAK